MRTERLVAGENANDDLASLLRHGFVIALLVGLVGAVLFASPAWDYSMSETFFRFAHEIDWFGWTMVGFSTVGNPLPGTVLTVAAATVLFLGGRRAAGMLLVVVPLGASLFNTLLKDVVARARPAFRCEGLDDCFVGGYSMPSGHAISATVLYGILALLVLKLWRDLSAAIVLLTLGALISVSRVFVGMHFASDILIAQSLGLVCVVLFAGAARKDLVGSTAHRNFERGGSRS